MRYPLATSLLLLLCASGASAQQDSPAPGIGEQAPPISVEHWLQAPEKAPTSWEGLRGNAVVVDFWATWCTGCVESIPHLNELVERFKAKPVRFLSITDEDEFVVTKFLRLKPMSGWIGLDTDGSTFTAYGVLGRPMTVLVDANGRVAAVTQLREVDDRAMEDLLAGKVPSVKLLETALERSTPTGDATTSVPAPSVQVVKAVIRPAPPGDIMNFDTEGGRFEAFGATFQKVVAHAYHVSQARVVAPAGLAGTTYDVEIVTPKGRSDLLYPLLHRALQETFGVTIRREDQEREVFILRAAKNHTLRPASPDGKVAYTRYEGAFVGRSLSLDALVTFLEDMTLVPVVDETGLQGVYDFEVFWDEDKPESFLRAVREQMGLGLTPAKKSVEVLVVESAQNPPTQ